MELSTELKDELVRLCPLVESHREELYEAASDPEIWKQHPAHDRWKKPVFDKFFDSAIDSKLAFVVYDNETSKCIGSSRYKRHDEEDDTVEIGWTFLIRECWGGEYNRSLKTLMIQNAFHHFDHVLLCIGDSNKRSARAAEKIGATLITDKSHRLYDHRPHYLTYKISKEL